MLGRLGDYESDSGIWDERTKPSQKRRNGKVTFLLSGYSYDEAICTTWMARCSLARVGFWSKSTSSL